MLLAPEAGRGVCNSFNFVTTTTLAEWGRCELINASVWWPSAFSQPAVGFSWVYIRSVFWNYTYFALIPTRNGGSTNPINVSFILFGPVVYRTHRVAKRQIGCASLISCVLQLIGGLAARLHSTPANLAVRWPAIHKGFDCSSVFQATRPEASLFETRLC